MKKNEKYDILREKNFSFRLQHRFQKRTETREESEWKEKLSQNSLFKTGRMRCCVGRNFCRELSAPF